ncbi:MAG: HEAT repeat domain-containing protein [Planctomycetota bacterium]|nr:MAG: HEAT repeat domain-containing protein [Planctomycetota bacterium]
MDTHDLIKNIKSKKENVRASAWQNAYTIGAPAIKPMATFMRNVDLEVARAAKRALWNIVRYACRPGCESIAKAVVAELIALCGDDQPAAVRREVLWMLSEIGGDEVVDPIAALLTNQDLREDARMVLQRIPGNKSLAALKAGLTAAPQDFKLNIAQSLRQRGVKVPGLPCQKLVPTKETKVEPVGR